MSNNGTDRDIALQLVSAVTAINTALVNINEKTFVPHIITQPTDQVVAVGSTASFTVVADNVKSYQWQNKLKQYPQNPWNNYTALTPSAFTDTLQITIVNNTYYQDEYRCEITGKDGSKIYTDAVTASAPTT